MEKFKSQIKYLRRGNFLDSEDGKWTICTNKYAKRKNGKAVHTYYTLLNRETHEYIMDNEHGEVRWWLDLSEVKKYIEVYSKEVR